MSEIQTTFTHCGLQAYLPNRNILVVDITSIKRVWDRSWKVYGNDAATNTTGAFRDKDILIDLVVPKSLPDSYKNKADLTMAFLQGMLEAQDVDTPLIEEAFNEALAKYRETTEEDE